MKDLKVSLDVGAEYYSSQFTLLHMYFIHQDNQAFYN